MIREKRAGMLHTLLEQGDVYQGSYQIGSQFNGPTSDAGLRIKHIEGKSTQAVSRGYQLFDASKISSKTENGVAFANNGNGSFTVTGEPTAGNFSLNYHLTHEETLALFKEGPVLCTNYNRKPYFYAAIFRDGINTGRETNTGGAIRCNITKDDIADPTFKIVLGFYGRQGDWNLIEGGTYKPMFYQDGNGDWEPFTGGKPGPQPEYPLINRSFRAYRFGSNAAEDVVLADRQCYLRSLPDGTHDEYIDGKVIRRIGHLVLDGSSDEVYVLHEMANGYTRASFIAPGGEVLQMRLDDVAQCDRLPCADSLRAWANPERECLSPISSNTPGNTGLVIKAPYGQDELRKWLSAHPLEILYKLGTPIVEKLSLPIIPTKSPRTNAWTDSDLEPAITWEALPAGSCALEVQALRKRIEELEKESVQNA